MTDGLDELQLPMAIPVSRAPERPELKEEVLRVQSITTRKMITWLQKHDPSGRLQVRADFGDEITINRPKGRGHYEVEATLEFK